MRFLYPLFSIVGFIVLWAGAAYVIADPLLPGPVEVCSAILREIRTGALWHHLFVTLWRVLASFIMAMAIGIAIGLAMGRSHMINGLFDPWLVFFLNIPALVVIFLCYIWGGLTEAAAIVAVVINKVPNVAVMLREGTRSLNYELEEMGQSFRYTRLQTFQHIILPQLQPFIVAAGRSGLSLIWKIVLVVEFIGRSDGVGFQLHTYFQLFDVAGILAYSLAFIAVMLLIEILIVQPWERYATRWRAEPA
ncbi:MAG: ABC transporter permease [Hyphomicrobiales bacterium]